MYVFIICVQTIPTTQRRGKTSKPRGGSNLCQSIFRPSSTLSCAQVRAIFSGGRLRGTMHQLNAQPWYVFSLILAPSLVTSVEPQVRKAWQSRPHGF
jgi:hypothetical protein